MTTTKYTNITIDGKGNMQTRSYVPSTDNTTAGLFAKQMTGSEITALGVEEAAIVYNTDTNVLEYCDDMSFKTLVVTQNLGTMAYENANAVTITAGTINGTTIGATTPEDAGFLDVTARDIMGYTLVGPGQVFETVAAALSYLDTTGATEYFIWRTGNTTETANYVSTNTNLLAVTFISTMVDNTDNGNYNLDFSACTGAGQFTIYYDKWTLSYNFTSNKNYLILPNIYVEIYINDFLEITNNSASTIAAPFVNKSLCDIYSTGFLSYEAQGGLSPITIRTMNTNFLELFGDGVGITYNMIVCSQDLFVNNLYLIGDFISNNYSNPLLTGNTVSINSITVFDDFYAVIQGGNVQINNCNVYESQVGGVSINASLTAFLNNSFYGALSRLQIYDSGTYNLCNSTLGYIDLATNFNSCSLFSQNMTWTGGTGQGIVGSDFYKGTAQDFQASGTSPVTLLTLKSSTYTFFANAQSLDFYAYITANLGTGGTANTYEFQYNGTTIYTLTVSNNTDFEINATLYRSSTTGLRMRINVITNGGAPILQVIDTTISVLANITFSLITFGSVSNATSTLKASKITHT